MIFIINSCIKKLLLEGNTFKPVKQHHIQWSVVKVPKFPPPPPALRTVIFTSIKQSLLLNICDNR